MYDTFYPVTAWSGGRDAEGVPWETLGIRALPWAPPMFQIPLLLYHPGKVGSILGGIFEAIFFTFCPGCHGPPLGLKHFCGLLPCFRCYQLLPSKKSWHYPFEFVIHAKIRGKYAGIHIYQHFQRSLWTAECKGANTFHWVTTSSWNQGAVKTNGGQFS